MDKEKLKKYRQKVLNILGKPELLELTEIKELLQELIVISGNKLDNSDIVESLKSLIKRFDDFNLQVNVDTKGMKLEPKIQVKPAEVNLKEIIDELKLLSGKLDSQTTNKLLDRLLVKIEKLNSIKATIDNWQEMPKGNKVQQVNVTNDQINTKVTNKVKVDWENKPEKKEEMPEEVTMELNNKDLWRSIRMKYPSKILEVIIDRNPNDVVRKLTFTER